MGRKARSPEDRFWDYVDKRGTDDCWLWNGSPSGGRLKYGRISYDGRVQQANRVSYMINIGPIPEGLDVLHTCDNTLCVNPRHLWVGTHTQNMQDKSRKGRGNSITGERHPKAKLTVEQVLELLDLSKQGVRQCELARKYGISGPAVWNIIHRINWPDKALAAPRKEGDQGERPNRID